MRRFERSEIDAKRRSWVRERESRQGPEEDA